MSTSTHIYELLPNLNGSWRSKMFFTKDASSTPVAGLPGGIGRLGTTDAYRHLAEPVMNDNGVELQIIPFDSDRQGHEIYIEQESMICTPGGGLLLVGTDHWCITDIDPGDRHSQAIFDEVKRVLGIYNNMEDEEAFHETYAEAYESLRNQLRSHCKPIPDEAFLLAAVRREQGISHPGLRTGPMAEQMSQLERNLVNLKRIDLIEKKLGARAALEMLAYGVQESPTDIGESEGESDSEEESKQESQSPQMSFSSLP